VFERYCVGVFIAEKMANIKCQGSNKHLQT